MVARHVHERLRLGVAKRRSLDIDDALERAGEEVGDPVRGQHEHDEARPAAQERERDSEE